MADDDEDDPFGMFGDDDDDDDNDDDDDEDSVKEANDVVTKIAQSLVNRENQRLSEATPKLPIASRAADVEKRASPVQEATTNNNVSPTIDRQLQLSWPDPLYLGPMVLATISSFGGGRGYVAQNDLKAGTLLLVESPQVSWPVDGVVGVDLDSILNIFGQPNAADILHAMEHFHPSKVEVDGGGQSTNPVQVDKMMELYQSQYEEENGNSQHLDSVVAAAAEIGLKNSDGTAITTKDVLRLLVALRYNSLQSGIYLHVAMLNHADFPNCVKFLPDDDSDDNNNNNTNPYSEVRTTRPVRAGEALTISYIPRLLSHASRRKYLWDQHRFDIGCADTVKPEYKKLELVNHQLPPSALERANEDTVTHRIEMTIADLEDQCREITKTTADFTPDEEERAKALEQASLELATAAAAQLGNPNHVLLLPSLQLHLDACDLVQRRVTLPSKQRVALLGRLIVTARKLMQLQELVLGSDHFDLARTQLDLAEAIGELLSRSPNQLATLFETSSQGPKSVTDFASLEAQVRREHERIKALWPHDTETYIQERI